MTIREQIKFTATHRLVRHVEQYGVSENFDRLAWEVIEGVCDRGGEESASYLATANDRGLDILCGEVANAAVANLRNLGIKVSR